MWIDAEDRSRLSGLSPRLWLLSGAEISREDLKRQLFDQNLAFVSTAFLDWEGLCLRILGIDSKRVLSPNARREGLRLLLLRPELSHRLIEVKKLRRQRRFIQRLDRAIQAGRLSFAHPEEGRVMRARLTERMGPSALRSEIEFLGAVYEAWLQGADLWDLQRLLVEATEKLKTQGWPLQVHRPEVIRVMSLQPVESRMSALLDVLSESVTVQRVFPTALITGEKPVPETEWEQWHTWDDAVEALADHWTSPHADWDRDVILIPSESEIRRTLLRAFKQRGIPIADPRDPDEAKHSESIKGALLPLKMLVSRFERETVISYLRQEPLCSRQQLEAWTKEIYLRGIQQGLEAYAGGLLSELHTLLLSWDQKLNERKTLGELAEIHLSSLKSRDEDDLSKEFYAKFWEEWLVDSELLGESRRRAPLRYWWELLQERITQAQVPVRRLRPLRGARIYRFTQAPVFSEDQRIHLYVLGLSADSLEQSVGDYWFSAREREVLSAEFSVRSSLHVRAERQASLQQWLDCSEKIRWLDALVSFDGKERESVQALLNLFPAFTQQEPQKKGAHPRWLPSYGGMRPVPSQRVVLEPRLGAEGRLTLEATELDHYSRCQYLALGLDRWKLRDLEEPDIELPAHIKGTLLHLAVEILIRSRSAQGGWGVTLREALEKAWQSRMNLGLLSGMRLKNYVKDSLEKVLIRFQQEEDEYFKRSHARVLSLEHDTRLEMDFPEARVRGRPDRIDELDSGVFVIDYKSGSTVPTGKEMFEKGYRLQLPFYALAAAQKFSKAALGAQFITLVRTGGRSRGVFLSEWNGKEEGKLTQVTQRNTSLFALPAEEIWKGFETQIREALSERVQGIYRVEPRSSEAECRSCSLRDLCGKNRKIDESESSE